ncbi:bifunctional diguanylate cyclase/phosphodiesterase [Marinomonas pollencensis]|uniref:bifunctional diguanylate cyclase/phosphodiesterase n=1 Tax=Marinomonas pollencensis TaxID=491954 RepID=UPI0015F250C2|nr:EAL domain-containing protein [Marinomonas pollencensis]
MNWLAASTRPYAKNAYLIVFLMVFLCGVVTCLALYHEEKQHILADERIAGEQFVTQLKDALNSYGKEIVSLSVMLQAIDEPLTYQVFKRASEQYESTEKNASLRLFFSQYVPAYHRNDYLEQQRSLVGQSGFTITPAGERAEYLPLTFGYPFLSHPGFDTLSDEAVNLAGLKRLRTQKSLEMSPPLSSTVDGKVQSLDKFALRYPVYLPLDNLNGRITDERGFYGVVGVVFDVSGLKAQLATQSERNFSYRLAEVTHDPQHPVWFADSSQHDNIHPNHEIYWRPGTYHSQVVHFAGCNWRVDTRYSATLISMVNWGLILSAFIVFSVLAVLLSAYVRMLSNAYNQTLRLAKDQIEVDELTGLFSRYKIQRELDEAIEDCQQKNFKLATFFLDLDCFKTINDAFGHETGDKLLIKVAQRLKSVFPDEAIIGRLGGDEFLVLLALREHEKSIYLEGLCREVILQISQSYFIDGRTLNIGCSIGVALHPNYGLNAETLVKNADMAMYEAKTAGRGTYYFYDEEMGARLSRNVRIETRLRQALQEDVLQLYFQPKVDLKTQKCVGLEALLRWDDSELGRVSPAEFIPVAEQTGIILTLGEWVIERACKHIVEWREEGVQVPPVAVNCSAAQLKRPNFLSHILSLLDKYKVDPSMLEIEVTESMLIEDAESCAELLRQVSQLGMKLAIDDFGTGYSSLSYLKDLPFDYVKIDQVFIHDIMEDNDHDVLTRAIINLSHELNLKVIAEGITRPDQLERLKGYGCDVGQGYLFSEALGANSMASDPMIMALCEQSRSASHQDKD